MEKIHSVITTLQVYFTIGFFCLSSHFFLDKTRVYSYNEIEGNIMKKKIRVRCPICGMLVWQDRLNASYEFEVLIQKSVGLGYGKGFHHEYVSPRDEDGVFLIKFALAEKLEAVARKLKGEAYSEQGKAFNKLSDKGKYQEAFDVYKTPSDIEAGVRGIDRVVVGSGTVREGEVILSPTAEFSQKLVEVSQPAFVSAGSSSRLRSYQIESNSRYVFKDNDKFNKPLRVTSKSVTGEDSVSSGGVIENAD